MTALWWQITDETDLGKVLEPLEKFNEEYDRILAQVTELSPDEAYATILDCAGRPPEMVLEEPISGAQALKMCHAIINSEA